MSDSLSPLVKPNGVYLASSDMAESLYELRKTEYARSDDFQHSYLDFLKWDTLDEGGIVLVVVESERIISTMRGVLVAGSDLLSARLAALLPPDFYCGHTLILERAATSHSHRISGLNSLLRLHFLRLAKEWAIDQVAGRVINGAKRMALLEELGYTFIPATPVVVPSDERHFPLNEDWLVATLNVPQQLEKALQILEERVHSLSQAYPWIGKRPPNLREGY